MKPFFLVVIALGVVVAPFFSGGVIKDLTAQDIDILYQIRIPRVMTAFLVGGGLAVSGAIFQSLFRNPLASPYTLGVASGASLGSIIGLSSGLYVSFGFLDTSLLFGYVGAFCSIILVYMLAKNKTGLDMQTLLLAGVAVGLTCSGFILFIQYLNQNQSTGMIVRWLMGSLEVVGFETPIKILIPVGSVFIYGLKKTKELDLISVGDFFSLSRGVKTNHLRLKFYFILSFTIAIIVTECGPIGFVGLIIPHIGRKLFGVKMVQLIPLSFLLGGFLLVLCDALSRSLTSTIVPVGVITTLLGGPFFLWVLRDRPKMR